MTVSNELDHAQLCCAVVVVSTCDVRNVVMFALHSHREGVSCHQRILLADPGQEIV